MAMPELAVLYEHPRWFEPLFTTLDRRAIQHARVTLDDHAFDPAASDIPAPLVLSRVAMSGFVREPDHGIYYAQALLAHWAARGARVLNGPDVMAIDASKARQLSLISGLGLATPATRVVHRPAELLAAAQAMRFPLLVKANVGGSGAGIARFDSPDTLAAAVVDRTIPQSIDKVLLLQEVVPARGGIVTRVETLGGKYLYAIDIAADGGFDLCPADACVAAPGRAAVRMTKADPPTAIVDAAERIARAAGLDLGGIEYMIDERDGTPRFFDINALSNFVADPLAVLGWDPHERLVDYLERAIGRRAAA